MKLKVTDLKHFKSNASSLKTNTLIPILSYIKFSEGEVTKNNLHSFCTQKIDGVTEPFLIDEESLMKFIENTEEEYVDIKIKDHRVFIDGKIRSSSPTEDVSMFPSPEMKGTDLFTITPEILSSIKIASSFIQTDESIPHTSNVFVGNGIVGASNGFIGFVDKIDLDCPEFLITKSTCTCISKMEKIKMSQTEKFIFFESDKTMFGFIKTEYSFIDFGKFVVYDKSKSKKIEVNKYEIIRFNDVAMSSTPAVVIIASFNFKKGILIMDMNDTTYERHVTSEIGVEGSITDEFKYMPHHMNQLLKNIPGNDVIFYQGENKLFVTGEGSATALIMKVL